MRVIWFCPPEIMASFKNPLDNPSYRLRCWYNYLLLKKEGHAAKIAEKISDAENADVLILMSYGEKEHDLTHYLKNKGKKVLHDYTENIRGIDILEKTKKMCDYIVCCSTSLAEEEKKIYKDKVVVIKDPMEEFPIWHNAEYENDKLKVVWSGMSGNAPLVEQFIKPIIESLDMEYVEISNRPEATITWERNTWYNHMAACDICVCPQDQWAFPTKSNVKLTTAISLGLPVICSPLPSYLEIIENGVNGYVAYTFEDWERYLLNLKNKSLRIQFAMQIWEKMAPYKIRSIYDQWKELFK